MRSEKMEKRKRKGCVEACNSEEERSFHLFPRNSRIRFFHRIKLLNAEIRVKERSEKARKLKQLGQFIA